MSKRKAKKGFGFLKTIDKDSKDTLLKIGIKLYKQKFKNKGFVFVDPNTSKIRVRMFRKGKI